MPDSQTSLTDTEATGTAPRRWPWVLLTIAFLAGSVGIFVALQVFKPRPTVKPIVRQIPIVRVAELQKRQGSLPVQGNGLVEPRNQVVLAAETQGRIVRLSKNLVSGGTVRRGELLVAIDSAPFKAALAQAQADRQSAAAALALAEQSIARTETLIEQGFLSRQTLDERKANRDQARAGLARARAIESQRRIDLGRTAIAAPFDGRVLSESVSIGDMVQPGREFARLFDDKALEVTVSLTGKDMSLVEDPWGQQSGQPAAATIQVSHGGRQFEWPAQVERIEAAIDSATRTFNVVVRPLDPGKPGRAIDDNTASGPPLLLGMYASARIEGRDLGQYYLLPRRALRGQNQLWLMSEQNTVEIVEAQVLTEIDDMIAVQISPEPRAVGVITSDLKVVTPGMQVRTAKSKSGAASAPEASVTNGVRPPHS